MIQFYFLSVVLNAIGGYTLFTDGEGREISGENGFKLSLDNEVFRLILGVAAVLVGLFKILSATAGDIPVIGDLIPAALGILTGFVFIFNHFKRRSSIDMENTEKLDSLLGKNQKWIGLASMVAAGLHFLFPSVLLL